MPPKRTQSDLPSEEDDVKRRTRDAWIAARQQRRNDLVAQRQQLETHKQMFRASAEHHRREARRHHHAAREPDVETNDRRWHNAKQHSHWEAHEKAWRWHSNAMDSADELRRQIDDLDGFSYPQGSEVRHLAEMGLQPGAERNASLYGQHLASEGGSGGTAGVQAMGGFVPFANAQLIPLGDRIG